MERVVALSALTVQYAAGYRRFADAFKAVEDAIKASGLQWTFLRSADYAANTLAWAPQIRSASVVWGAYGDAAWVPDAVAHGGLPPTAQAADHEGRYVGRIIASEINGRTVRPFRFQPLGHLTLLGRYTGVAEVGPLTFTGLPAWLLWHSYYLSHIPSLRNRLRLVSDWFVSGLAGRETAQLRLESGQQAHSLTRLFGERKRAAGPTTVV